MQIRHRIPTIFNIYMLDVLCCALGCVVLLWQLYHYESEEHKAKATEQMARANEQTAKANESLSQLQAANVELQSAYDQLRKAQLSIASLSSEVSGLKIALESSKKREIQVTLELDDTRKDRDRLDKLALVRKQEYDALKKNHVLVEAMLANSRSDYKALQQQSKLTAAELADKIKAHAELLTKMASAEKRLSALEKELAIKQGDLSASLKRIDDFNKSIKLTDDRAKKLEKALAELRRQEKDCLAKLTEAELRAKLLAQDLEFGKKDYLSLERRFQDMLKEKDSLNQKFLVSAKDLAGLRLALVAVEGERDSLKGRLMLSVKEIADAKLLITGLSGDKMSLLKQNQAIRAAAENRFAGITLTGGKVIFLVDMSGSMGLIDEKTPDPDKWPLVCDIVGKLMKSLPELKEYQVILFSDKVRYPLANEGRWLTYHPEHSPKAMVEALKAMKPKDGTNLFIAFEEAFKYRDKGLDAVYLFSDGLPNDGPGLPADVSKLSESQQGEILGRYLRGKLKTWNQPRLGERVRINTIGFFFESPDLGAFLWTLARENEGSFVGMSRP